MKNIEIERRWLVKTAPTLLLEYKRCKLSQGYLVYGEHGSARIRKIETLNELVEDAYVLTIKRGKGVVRSENEIFINKTQFDSLWHVTDGARVVKKRTSIPLDHYIAEYDVFENLPLSLVEVEFPSTEHAHNFIAPDWFGAEVTNNGEYTNICLALYGMPKTVPV